MLDPLTSAGSHVRRTFRRSQEPQWVLIHHVNAHSLFEETFHYQITTVKLDAHCTHWNNVWFICLWLQPFFILFNPESTGVKQTCVLEFNESVSAIWNETLLSVWLQTLFFLITSVTLGPPCRLYHHFFDENFPLLQLKSF